MNTTSNVCRWWCLVLLLSSCGWNADPESGMQPAVSLDPPPPPVRGGTLTVRSDDREVLLVDRDRAIVHALALGNHTVLGDETWSLAGRARPERALYTTNVPVVVLADGMLLALEPGSVLTPVGHSCAGVRGALWDDTRGTVWVSCADGELSAVHLADATTRTTQLPPDLGDVVMQDSTLRIALVRSAQVLAVDPDSTSIIARVPMPAATQTQLDLPQGALRLLATPLGTLVLHERMRQGQDAFDVTHDVISNVASLYSFGHGPCGTGAEQVAVSLIGDDSVDAGPTVPGVAYASDLAYDPASGTLAVASPSAVSRAGDPTGPAVVMFPFSEECPTPRPVVTAGQASAVAFLHDGTLLVQTREPVTLAIGEGRVFALGGESVRDTGHDFFTLAAAGRLPCAACHIDGGTDGHVWTVGTRTARTMTLRGGISASAPYGWDGALPDLASLLDRHFPSSPDSIELRPAQVAAFAHWADALPDDAVAPSDPALRATGAALFADHCASCHGDDGRHPMARSVDIGRGTMQVPSLAGVSGQSPLGRDGCAPDFDSLLQGACGIGSHSIAAAGDRDALAAFLGIPPTARSPR